MAFPSKEEIMAGNFKVDQANFKADLEEKIAHIIELAKSVRQKRGGGEKPANQTMAH